MSTLKEQAVGAAEVLARVGILGAALEVDLGPLIQRAATLGEALGSFARVTIDSNFQHVSVMAPWSVNTAPSDVLDLDGLQRERLQRVLDRPSKDRYAEVWLRDGGLGFAAHSFGGRPLAEDIALIDELSRATESEGAEPRRVARLLAAKNESVGITDRAEPKGHHSWLLHTAQASRANGIDASIERLTSTARAIGVTEPQIELMADLHPILAGSNTVMASLRFGPGVVFPELRITYRDLRMENVVRMFTGLANSHTVGNRLGRFAGEFDSDVASALEFIVRNEEPPLARVSVDIVGGSRGR